MWADCFHISCNFPFLNEKSGTALDLNYFLGAETFEISKHFFNGGFAAKPQQTAQQSLPFAAELPVPSSEEKPAEGRDGSPKAAFACWRGSSYSMTLKAHGMH